MTRVSVFAALLAGAASLAGCANDGRRPVYPVTGTVTVNGKPADNVLLWFKPADEADAMAPKPTGRTGPDGTLRVTTYETGDGLPEGEYFVSAEWPTKVETMGRILDGADRFKGKYKDGKAQGRKVTVGKGPAQLPPLDFAAR